MTVFNFPAKKYLTQSEEEMVGLAGKLYCSWDQRQFLCYLTGDLGSGKTTFVRSFLREAGVEGTIKSPTYSIIELYDLTFAKFAHIDLYRLSSLEDIEGIGLLEIIEEYSCFIEWPSRISLTKLCPDINIEIEKQSDSIHCCSICFK